MTKHSCLLLIFPLFFIASCAPGKSTGDLDWMLGKWIGSREDMSVHEIWEKGSDGRMNGQGVALMEEDTLFYEKMNIEVRDQNLYFTADIPGNQGPVSFKLTLLETHKAVFENPEHDFPKSISYRLVTPDSLVAEVEGDDSGKHSKEVFHYRKSK